MEKIRNTYARNPLLFILLAAFVLRSAAAFYNYTPTAEDDYANVIEPALNHYQTGAAISTELYRLPMLPKVFYSFIAPLKIFSVKDTTILVSWGLFCLGLFSLLGVWAFFRMAQNLVPEKAHAAGWLYAAHVFLPFFTTRAFQESLSLTTVPLAMLYFTTPARSARNFMMAGLFIGLTVIVRFQAGILALTLLGYLSYQLRRKSVTLQHVGGFIAGGAVALALLVWLDLAEGRGALATPIEYVRINFLGNVASENYGSAPWHTYLTLLAAVFIPPFSLVLLVPFFRALRHDWLSTLCLGIFLLSHSLIGNKLERFMLPVIPFFFLLTLRGLRDYGSNRAVRFGWRGFIFANALLLLPVTLSRSQLNIIDAAQYLTDSPRPLLLFRIDLWKQAYLTFAKPVPANYTEIGDLKKTLLAADATKTDVLSLGALPAEDILMLARSGIQCSRQREFTPSWQEEIVIRLNPKFNARRAASVLYLCERGAR